MACDVRWIRLTTDMFDNRKVKYLRRLPEGNNIVLIWVMLLTMAGRCNAGGMIFLTENIPYTAKMLADELDFEEGTVRLAIDALARLGMVLVDGECLTIAGWEEHQNIEGMERIREQNRLRKQKQREGQRLLMEASRDSHVTVTQCHAIEEDIEEEIEIDKEIYSSIIAYLNEKAGTKYKSSSQKTRTCINGRLAEGFKLEDFKAVIDKKCAEWLGDQKMEQYLRPETLFGTKFEGYLNAKVSPSKAKNQPIDEVARKEAEDRELDAMRRMYASMKNK